MIYIDLTMCEGTISFANKGLCPSRYGPKSCCKMDYEKSMGLSNFAVDKILQGLCVEFKMAIPCH